MSGLAINANGSLSRMSRAVARLEDRVSLNSHQSLKNGPEVQLGHAHLQVTTAAPQLALCSASATRASDRCD